MSAVRGCVCVRAMVGVSVKDCSGMLEFLGFGYRFR